MVVFYAHGKVGGDEGGVYAGCVGAVDGDVGVG